MLSDPLLDIRIAAWMATPEDKRLKDDNATSLRASDNAYTAEALLRCACPFAWGSPRNFLAIEHTSDALVRWEVDTGIKNRAAKLRWRGGPALIANTQ